MAKSARSAPPAADPTALGHRFRQRLRRGDLMLGAIAVEYLRPSLARHQAAAGYDFVFVETEHGLFAGDDLADYLLACRAASLPVVAKVGELGRSETARLLDAGACAIQLPRTESAAQLAELAGYMKYLPAGTRAGAPGWGNTDYLQPGDHAAWLRRANGAVSLVAHIETAAGYERAAEIVASPHVDVVYVGPYDFSIAMGRPGDYDHPDVAGPMGQILRLCRARGVCFGTSVSGVDAARRWVRRGARFFEMSSELDLIARGAAAEVAAYRQAGG